MMEQNLSIPGVRRPWPFKQLMPLKYGTILTDNPWEFKTWSKEGKEKSPDAHYECMSLEDIMALPVGELASRDCLLMMWCTWPHLAQGLQVMKAWGFQYKTGGSWFKRTRYGKAVFGTGYIFRSSCEPYLVGTIGRPKISVRNQRNIIETEELIETEDYQLIESHMHSLRREHSRKPPEMHDMLRRMRPHDFAAELFARETVEGFEAWGNEVHKFNGKETKDGRKSASRRPGAGGDGSELRRGGPAPAHGGWPLGVAGHHHGAAGGRSGEDLPEASLFDHGHG